MRQSGLRRSGVLNTFGHSIMHLFRSTVYIKSSINGQTARWALVFKHCKFSLVCHISKHVRKAPDHSHCSKRVSVDVLNIPPQRVDDSNSPEALGKVPLDEIRFSLPLGGWNHDRGLLNRIISAHLAAAVETALRRGSRL